MSRDDENLRRRNRPLLPFIWLLLYAYQRKNVKGPCRKFWHSPKNRKERSKITHEEHLRGLNPLFFAVRML